MAKNKIIRLTDAENELIEYLRNMNAFEIKDLYNELSIIHINSKNYLAEVENIRRKEADEKYHKNFINLLTHLKVLVEERESETIKKMQ